eukprot:760075-Hanusia_phi.AAC.1
MTKDKVSVEYLSAILLADYSARQQGNDHRIRGALAVVMPILVSRLLLVAILGFTNLFASLVGEHTTCPWGKLSSGFIAEQRHPSMLTLRGCKGGSDVEMCLQEIDNVNRSCFNQSALQGPAPSSWPRPYVENWAQKNPLNPNRYSDFKEEEVTFFGYLLLNDTDACVEMIQNGVDINYHDTYLFKMRPLHFAAAYEDPIFCEMLLSAGANQDGRDWYGSTPLMHAASHGRLVNMFRLIASGSLVNAKNKCGNTALHLAAMNDQYKSIQILLEKGAWINPRNARNETPLHFAAMSGSKLSCKMLVRHGANVDARDVDGNTPIVIAVKWNFVELVDFLKNKTKGTEWQKVAPVVTRMSKEQASQLWNELNRNSSDWRYIQDYTEMLARKRETSKQ